MFGCVDGRGRQGANQREISLGRSWKLRNGKRLKGREYDAFEVRERACKLTRSRRRSVENGTLSRGQWKSGRGRLSFQVGRWATKVVLVIFGQERKTLGAKQTLI